MKAWNNMDMDQQAHAFLALARAALACWRLDGAHLSLIKHRENAVYQVKDNAGRRYALRIHRPGYHADDKLQSELAWMAALQEDGIDVPRLVRTDSGALFARVTLPELPMPFQVDLFDWVDGAQLGSSEYGLGADRLTIERTYRTVGALAARLHAHAQRWTVPVTFTRHAWDLEGLVGDQPLWGCFWKLELLTAEQRALILRARRQADMDLRLYARSATSEGEYGLIHADFVPENLLADGERVRVIDFDDCGFGWHLFDLATALYFIQKDRHFDTARAALIAGYRQHRSLSDASLAYLPLFLLVRSFTYLGWVHTRKHSETASALSPYLIELACRLAAQYLEQESSAAC